MRRKCHYIKVERLQSGSKSSWNPNPKYIQRFLSLSQFKQHSTTGFILFSIPLPQPMQREEEKPFTNSSYQLYFINCVTCKMQSCLKTKSMQSRFCMNKTLLPKTIKSASYKEQIVATQSHVSPISHQPQHLEPQVITINLCGFLFSVL